MMASPSCDFFYPAASLLEAHDFYKPSQQFRLQDLLDKADRIHLPELKELIVQLLPLK